MLRFRDTPAEDREGRMGRSGIIGGLRGSRLLPDLPTAILARHRGYVGGSYPAPLDGAAKELGYYPLQSASAEELTLIMEEMKNVIGR